MAWYRSGTASFTNGSTTVTGAGTNWIEATAVGEAIQAPDGKIYEIAAVVSATQLTIGSPYTGSTQANQPYAIAPTQGFLRDLAEQAAALVNTYSGTISTAGQGKFGDGTVSAPGMRFVADEDTGIRRAGSNLLALVAGGVDVMTFSPSGASGAAFTGPISSTLANTVLDWNTLTRTGWFMGQGATGAPSTDWFIGYCVAHTADWITQEVWAFALNIESSDTQRYRREKNNGSWGPWLRVYSTAAEIAALTAGKANLDGVVEFTGGRKRFISATTSPNWDHAQVEVYSPQNAAVDFSRIAFHVQDAFQAYQFGFDAATGRAGWFDASGAALLTWGAPGDDLRVPGSGSFSGPLFINTAAGGGEAKIEIGHARNADGVSYIDLISVAGADYSGRVLRAPGANGNFNIDNAGVGLLAANLNGATRLTVSGADGGMRVCNSVGLGYGNGSGGSVTQAVSKAEPVYLDKPSGLIVTHNQEIPANNYVVFTVFNSCISASDVVVLSLVYGYGEHTAYRVTTSAINAGAFSVRIDNLFGVARAETLHIRFAKIGGSAS